jgi:hypothetical protein
MPIKLILEKTKKIFQFCARNIYFIFSYLKLILFAVLIDKNQIKKII